MGVAAADPAGFQLRIAPVQLEMDLPAFHRGDLPLREGDRVIIDGEIAECHAACPVGEDYCADPAFRRGGGHDDPGAVAVNHPVPQVGENDRTGQAIFLLRKNNLLPAAPDGLIQFRLKRVDIASPRRQAKTEEQQNREPVNFTEHDFPPVVIAH